MANYTCRGSYRQVDTQILKPKEDSLAIRMLIRLVLLHQYAQLTTSQWKAIAVLKPHKESIKDSEELNLQLINSGIRLVREVTKCGTSESDHQDLYWRVGILSLELDMRLLCRPWL